MPVIYLFGTAPKAKSLGYKLTRTVDGTPEEVLEMFQGLGVILVEGPIVFGSNIREYGVYLSEARADALDLQTVIDGLENGVSVSEFCNSHGEMTDANDAPYAQGCNPTELLLDACSKASAILAAISKDPRLAAQVAVAMAN